MLKWSISPIHLDLKYTWTISRGSVSHKTNYLVTVAENGQEMIGEVAGITQKEVNENKILNEFKTVTQLKPQNHKEIINLPISAPLRFGLESALTHLRCLQENKSLYNYLKLPKPVAIKTSYSIPILEIDEVASFINKQNIFRFPYCKIKIDSIERARNCFEVAKYFPGHLRIDANEAFSSAEEVLELIKFLTPLKIQFIEQPMPATNVNEYVELKNSSSLPIFADESLQDQDIDNLLFKQFHGVNIKLMKAGSYQQASNQLAQAKTLKLKTMFGCMLETSLAISGAVAVGQLADYHDLDGFLFFKNEPLRLIKEHKGLLKF